MKSKLLAFFAAALISTGALADTTLYVTDVGGHRVPVVTTGSGNKLPTVSGAYTTGHIPCALDTSGTMQDCFSVGTGANTVAAGNDSRITGAAQKAASLSDLASPSAARGNIGLGNVDNTSDATKNAAAVTLTNKTLTAPVINSPAGLVRGDVGLGNVDNTNDASKPVSTAQAAADALNLKIGSNLADLNNAATARTNLGLHGAALLDVGTTAGTVAAGNDSRFSACIDGYAFGMLPANTAASNDAAFNSALAFISATQPSFCLNIPGTYLLAASHVLPVEFTAFDMAKGVVVSAATVATTATTLSALASDNSFNDSANGFITAGYAVGQSIVASGFTTGANNATRRVVTALTAGKMTFAGTDGDTIVDDAAGPSITLTAGNVPILTKSGSIGALVGAASPVPEGSVDMTMDTSSFAVDEWVFVKSNDSNPLVTAGLQNGYLRKVVSLGAQMHVDAAFTQDMTSSIHVRKATLCKRVTFTGGTFTAQVQANQTNELIYTHLCENPTFINVTFRDSGGPAVHLDWGAAGGQWINSNIFNLLDDGITHFGYGIQLSGATRDYEVVSGVCSKARHCFTTTTGEPDGSQTDSRGNPESNVIGPGFFVYNTTNAGIDTHEAGYNNHIYANVHGAMDCVEIRANRTFIDGGNLSGCRRNAIKVSPPASNQATPSVLKAWIKNIVIENVADDGAGATAIAVQKNGMEVWIDNLTARGYSTACVSTVAGSKVHVTNALCDGIDPASLQTAFDLNSSGNTIRNSEARNNLVGIDEASGQTGNVWNFMTFTGNTTDVQRVPTYPIVDPVFVANMNLGKPTALDCTNCTNIPGSGGALTGTYAAMIATSSPSLAQLYFVTNVGANGGSLWRYGGSTWKPVGGRVLVGYGAGTLASPIATISGTSATTSFTLPGGSPTVVANVLGAGSKVHTEGIIRKNGTGSTFNAAMRLGTSNSASDASIWAKSAVANVDNRQVWPFGDASIQSTTSMFRVGTSIPLQPGSENTASGSDTGTNINTAADMFFTISISGQSAADSFDLVSYEMWITP